MRAQELELWARDIVEKVLSNQPVEDSRVELKSEWIEPEKAARRLGGHANAARGDSILWLIGIDEKNRMLATIDPVEFESWFKSVQSHFDGFAPRLLLDVNIRIEGSTVVSLYFDTVHEAPYVIKSSKGGYPDFIVPWREGTRLRAARRQDLLSILVPIRRFSALLDELEFNRVIARTGGSNDFYEWGCPFRDEEFHRVLREGAMATLPPDVKRYIHLAYVGMGRANQRVSGGIGTLSTEKLNEARSSVGKCLPQIIIAQDALQNFITSEI